MFSNKCGSSLLGLAVFCAIVRVSLGATLADLSRTDAAEIERFRQYIRIPSFHPNINYQPCVDFLVQQAADLNLTVSVTYPVDLQNPVVVITWVGTQPSLPSIMLNSHMDVVPAFAQSWTYPPFNADVDANGRIYGRGTQDTKDLAIIHLAAIRRLKAENVQLKRTVHVTFVPDEEVGGSRGMEGFALSQQFRDMNVGYALDEGGVSPINAIGVYYDERCPWQIEFVCNGPTGHASLLLNNTAGQKITYLMGKFMKMRADEVEKANAGTPAGKVTSINLTILKGGVQANVVPPQLSVVFDVRLGVDVNHVAFEKKINKWCDDAGGDITINYLVKTPKAPASTVDSTSPLWNVISTTAQENGIPVIPSILVGATDMRFLRRQGVQGYGFSPIVNTPVLLHADNEYVAIDELLKGIALFKKVLQKLGNI